MSRIRASAARSGLTGIARVNRSRMASHMLASKAESPRPTLSERLAKRLAALFGVVALLGLLHTFFGFGVAFAISATFGLDAAEILHGPADYLAASYMVVIPLFNGLDAKLNSAAGIADQIFLGMWLGGAGALISLIWFCRNYRPIGWVAPTARKAFTAAKCLSARVPLHIRERLGKVSWRLPVAVGSIVIPGLLPWLSIWVVVTLMVVGVLPFVVGMKLAQQYFFETVIEPVLCHSLVTAKEHRRSVEVARAKTDPTPWKEHREIYRVSCVRVELQGFGRFEGRRIIATADVIALYEPNTGSVVVLPKSNAVVTTIHALAEVPVWGAKP